MVASFHVREITWIGFHAFLNGHPDPYSLQSIASYATFPLVWGAIGVPVFFVLSGYCIHRAEAFRSVRTPQIHFSSRNFLLRRFFRIYPVLAGALILTLICDSLSRHYFPNSAKLGDDGIVSFLTNLFSLQGILGKPYGSNLALWTLALEVQFYAIYPLLLRAMRSYGIAAVGTVIIAANIAAYYILERQGFIAFPSYYFSWFIGVAIAQWEANRSLGAAGIAAMGRNAWYLAAAAGLGLGCLVWFRQEYLAFQIWAVSFSFFLWADLHRTGFSRGYIHRFFRWLGGFSYSLYVVHLPLAVLLHSVFFHSVHQASIVPFFDTMVLIIGFAFVFHIAIERPAQALSKKFKYSVARAKN
jgi:peptidoglycan/LPS O-acetylase OafA/YrhL